MINLPGGREHFDIYLAKTIYPVLVPGLESLAREIDRLQNSDGMHLFDSLINMFRAYRFKYKRKI